MYLFQFNEEVKGKLTPLLPLDRLILHSDIFYEELYDLIWTTFQFHHMENKHKT